MTIRSRIIIFILLTAVRSASCTETSEIQINRTFLSVILLFIYIYFISTICTKFCWMIVVVVFPFSE